MTTHLWWNGYDHSHGADEKEALYNLMRFSGCTAEECEGDGWVMVPDDQPMFDDGDNPTGKVMPTGETARQYAESMARHDAALAAPREDSDGR